MWATKAIGNADLKFWHGTKEPTVVLNCVGRLFTGESHLFGDAGPPRQFQNSSMRETSQESTVFRVKGVRGVFGRSRERGR
jgi:hypothetical protein